MQAHKRHERVVTVHTPFELKSMMGGFEPARWDPDGRCYLLEIEHVEAFVRFVRIHGGHQVLDDRPRDGGVALGPLPECSSCGQPASRKVALTLSKCPGCGDWWRPVVFDPVAARGVVVGRRSPVVDDAW